MHLSFYVAFTGNMWYIVTGRLSGNILSWLEKNMPESAITFITMLELHFIKFNCAVL